MQKSGSFNMLSSASGSSAAQPSSWGLPSISGGGGGAAIMQPGIQGNGTVLVGSGSLRHDRQQGRTDSMLYGTFH